MSVSHCAPICTDCITHRRRRPFRQLGEFQQYSWNPSLAWPFAVSLHSRSRQGGIVIGVHQELGSCDPYKRSMAKNVWLYFSLNFFREKHWHGLQLYLAEAYNSQKVGNASTPRAFNFQPQCSKNLSLKNFILI